MTLIEANLALSQKLPMDDINIRRRLERAYDIIRMPGYEIFRGPSQRDGFPDNYWIIDKLSTSLLTDESAQYTIVEDLCSCPDAATARAGLCKHRLAVALLELMEEE